MSELSERLMKQLRFISEASNAFMSQKKQKFTGQQRVLAILRLEDGLVQSYLAEVLDLRPSSLAELMKKMEKSGDVTREEDENDKRTKRVYLTEQGRTKAEKNASFKQENQSEIFFAGLTEEEQTTFSDLLEKISSGWSGEFHRQSEKFIDPLDRFQAMQEMREALFEEYGGDWQNLPPEDLRKMRREMKRMMRKSPFGERGGRPDFSQDFPNRFGRDFRREFWRGGPNERQHPFNKDDSQRNNDDEWEDF
ncbi:MULTISPECIES: MarR family winged helix-turn-helix transcriptional regulator [Enterococcus]|uniref:MarR family transcriptional regulator n=1 Tax=Enterococcus thailandicus TaxID=417368 RepID=A0A179ETU7_ENTTH|nr:MarR family winged helix-turn-helix transcriptional regulator [Enterococcus thailandicus]ASZ07532.1 MarR family transcriptional regulator [Enterococcus thailandicus]MDT2750780.1 MarR family winged helix-turn-helix transcriptional regulator [Enterococcus thailandicus]MDT2775339.1 MarR family winged helix-turn-helix transcriptional regulator [Enterococcus thailandicus]MDT2845708.1 MarR family winged helix-turn-helix transcriptional regulator [Enterococcus thailandicus]OAQ56370.1 MarR family t